MNPGWIWILFTPLVLWVVGGEVAGKTAPGPRYTVLRQAEGYEIRQYEAMVLAQTPMEPGGRYGGFRRLFRYISGENAGAAKVPMTTPVLETGSLGNAIMAFVMPQGSALEMLPSPAGEEVTLRSLPAFRAAAVRFSGWAGAERMRRKTRQLEEALERDGLRAAGPPLWAFYDPPWRPPFLRRNEVLIPIM